MVNMKKTWQNYEKIRSCVLYPIIVCEKLKYKTPELHYCLYKRTLCQKQNFLERILHITVKTFYCVDSVSSIREKHFMQGFDFGHDRTIHKIRGIFSPLKFFPVK